MKRNYGKTEIKKLEELTRSLKAQLEKVEKEKEMILKESSKKPHSPRNGEIMSNGRPYSRTYDFNRDSWKDLCDKLCSPKWNCSDRSKYLPLIMKKLNERIKKGCCSQCDVDNYLMSKKRKIINADICLEDPFTKNVTNIKAKKVVINNNFFLN